MALEPSVRFTLLLFKLLLDYVIYLYGKKTHFYSYPSYQSIEREMHGKYEKTRICLIWRRRQISEGRVSLFNKFRSIYSNLDHSIDLGGN